MQLPQSNPLNHDSNDLDVQDVLDEQDEQSALDVQGVQDGQDGQDALGEQGVPDEQDAQDVQEESSNDYDDEGASPGTSVRKRVVLRVRNIREVDTEVCIQQSEDAREFLH